LNNTYIEEIHNTSKWKDNIYHDVYSHIKIYAEEIWKTLDKLDRKENEWIEI
jgi:hypothetical protein